MFELEDYSSGFHEGFLSKYADSSGPTLDFYISDSMQDMLDIDIRSEIENVVGCGDPEFSSITSNLHHLLDQSLNANQSLNHNSSTSNGNGSMSQSVASTSTSTSTSSSSSSSLASSNPWYCVNTGPSWSSSANSDYYADIGACVNPISVMPLISSTLLHKSPKANLNSSGLPQPPASPNARETSKSHLTFSPAQMKISAGSIRHEQILSHIPKQIVAISSSVTAATTAPATLATNSALQRKVAVTSAAVDAIKKDLGAELRRSSADDSIKSNILASNILNGSAPSSTIKLAPGIGGLTFANSITYNKLKQQSTTKSPQCSPIGANGSIVMKRDRDSSPMRSITTANGQSVSKILARNMVQSANGFTPKSIASAHSPLMHNNGIAGAGGGGGGGGNSGSIGSPSSASSMSASSPSSGSSGFSGSFSAGLTSLNGHHSHHTLSTSNSPITVKSLQQKINKQPATIESEYPKPAYSYSCLIAMALKNSRSGSLPVSEIYSFMCEHFPYFNTAPSGWKNSVRHNLSLNKCFEKIEKPATNGSQRKGCLWAMNPDRIIKMDEEVQKWSRKDPAAIRNAMVYPEHLEALERGEMKHGSSADSEIELDSQSEIEDTSDLEEPEDIDDTIVDSMFVEEDVEEEELVADDDGIVVMNDSSCHDDGDELCMNGGDLVENEIDDEIDDSELLRQQQDQQQQQRDFDIEVEDFYDSIDIEDDKEAVRMAINQSDIIEISPADLNAREQSPKRARLDVNYSIGPVGELEKHIVKQQHKPLQQQFKKFRFVQNQQQQHFFVQAIPAGNATTIPATTTANVATFVTSNNNTIANKNNNNNIIIQKQIQHIKHIQQVTTIPQHNRRKMQLVNRIA